LPTRVKKLLPLISRLPSITRFWDDEYNLTALLVMLVLTLFVVTPLASSALIGSEIMLAFVAVLTVTGVAAVSGNRGMLIVVIILAAAGIGLDWAAHFANQKALWVIDDLSRLAFVLMLAVIVTVRVFRPGNITHHRVQGAICVYLLAGMAWAYSYSVLLAFDPAAIHISETYDTASVRTGLIRYFSFVTLTTLGYGDIVPVSPIARSLAASEALFGQLYPAIMIARLISLSIIGRRQRD
jgi:hypothetical protein